MTYLEILKALRDRVAEMASLPLYSVQEVPSPTPSTGFMVYSVVWGQEAPTSAGTALVRMASRLVLQVEIHVPLAKRGTAYGYAEQLAALFRTWSEEALLMIYWRLDEPAPTTASPTYFTLHCYGGFERHEVQTRATA